MAPKSPTKGSPKAAGKASPKTAAKASPKTAAKAPAKAAPKAAAPAVAGDAKLNAQVAANQVAQYRALTNCFLSNPSRI